MRRRTLLVGMAGLLAAPSAIDRVRTSDPFEPIGRIRIDGAKEVVVGGDGATAYVATTDGFAIVSVSDPANPTLLAERRDLLSDREDGPMESIWDVKVAGDRLLVAGPAASSENVSGFLLYDVTDPEGPQRVAFYETTYPIHNAYLTEDAAYLTAAGSFVAVDLSGDEPQSVGQWAVTDADGAWAEVPGGLRAPHDLLVQNGVAYVACWDAGTWLVDVADPGSPATLGRVGGLPREDLAELSSAEASRESVEPPGNHHYVQPSSDGSLLAVGIESWGTDEESGGPGGIELWDVDDPSTPRKLSEIEPPRAIDETRSGTWTTSHNFDLDGDRLVSSWYQGGVKLHDVGDPADPEELAWWREPDEAAFWAAVHATEEFFVASSTSYPAPDATEGLFTFPNRLGEQPNPPPLAATPTRTSQFGTTGTHNSSTTDARTTGTPAPTTNAGTDANGSAPDRTTAETGGQAGFGVPATVVAALGGLWWRSHAGSESGEGRSE